MLSMRSVAEAVERIRASDLGEVRSFHLVAAEPGGPAAAARLARFRWNGSAGAWDEAPGPRLLVSSSLAQQPGLEESRRSSWRRFLGGGGTVDADAVAAFLAGHERERGPLSVCMHRPEGGTVSRTIVEATESRVGMSYLPGPPCEANGPERVIRLDRVRDLP
jgi:hypothetical protein